MANTKTTALTALTAPVPADLAMVVDVSDSTMDAAGTNKKSTLAVLLGMLTSNVISGLALSNNVSDANNDLDIAAGVATVSDGSAWHLAALTSTLVKQLDATWAVGTNAGGLDTGSEANSTWYHVWLIQRSDTGVVDVLFSTSATAPTVPTNYDRKRRIGAIYNNSSGNIDAFTQYGDEFLWASRDLVSAANPGTSAVLRAVRTPLGVVTKARINASVVDNSYSATTYLLVSSPATTDVAPTVTAAVTAMFSSTGVTTGMAASDTEVFTNTSSQVRTRVNNSDADITIRIQTIGWIDPRGSY